jgi:hypothetical protein
MRKSTTIAIAFLAISVASAETPRELTDAQARAVAYEFLARGAAAPLRGLEPRDLDSLRTKEGTHALHGPTISIDGGRWSIEVARRGGAVVAFSMRGALHLQGRTEDERRAELARRTRLPLERAEARAREFLSFRVDDWASRRFELVSARTTIEDGWAAHRVELVERGPRAFANRLVVSIDPTSEDVVAFTGSDVREAEQSAPERRTGPAGEIVRVKR